MESTTDERARRVAQSVAERLTSGPHDEAGRTRLLLEGAIELAGPSGNAGAGGPRATGTRRQEAGLRSRETAQWLRHRVRGEQTAVTLSIHLAQRARDELTRAILRQIASDSLRHAEIVASLVPYLDRGILETQASGITRKDVEALIRGEERAEAEVGTNPTSQLRGTMALLLESMEADERKHAELLKGLLEGKFEEAPLRRRPGRKGTSSARL